MLLTFFLTFVVRLVQFPLENTVSGAREPWSRFSFFWAAFSVLALPKQPKTFPLESIICEMLIL